MNQTADIGCAQKLLKPTRLVVKSGRHVRLEPFERRVALWNEIRSNYGRYLKEECGIFLDEVDLHMRSQFDAALVAIISSCIENNEEFSPVSRYSPEEIDLWRRVERYNIFEILSEEDLRNRILKRDTDLLVLLKEYYLDMDRYVSLILENPEIRLTLRYYIKRRWGEYRRKMDAAISDAVTRFDWMQDLVAEWDTSTPASQGP